jgi:hypothetical protein
VRMWGERLKVRKDGVPVGARPHMNFIGPGVTVADDSSQDEIEVTIAGGGGGGGAPLDAPYVVTAADPTLTAEKVLGSEIQMRDVIANLPAAGIAGRRFQGIDDGGRIYRDNGTSWDIELVPRPLMWGRPRTLTQIFYNLPGVQLFQTASVFPTAGHTYYLPFYCLSESRLERFEIEVMTAGAVGSLARWGIFRATQNWQPDDLRHDNTTTIAVDTIGVKQQTPTTNPIILPPGRYMAAFVTDAVGLELRSVRGGIPGAGLHFNLGANPFIVQMAYQVVTLPTAAFPAQGNDWAAAIVGATPMDYFMFFRQNIADPTNP